MPALDISVSHDLGVDEASNRVRGLASHLRVKYGTQVTNIEESWSGHSGEFAFKLMGAQLKGETDVSAGDVRVRAKLPFAAMMFKGAIEKAVRDELVACLAGDA